MMLLTNFQLLSWVNWCVGRHRGGSFSGDIRSKSNSGSWIYNRRVLDIGPDIRGRISFMQSRPA